jgi:hypothetical protein
MARPISTSIIAKANKAAITAGTNNIIPSGSGNYTTRTPNVAIGQGGIGTAKPAVFPGPNGYTKSYTITLLGRKFEIDSYLSDTTKFHLAQIDFHGILFYKSLKNMNIEFHVKEITDFLDTMLKMQERDTQLENILEKIN